MINTNPFQGRIESCNQVLTSVSFPNAASSGHNNASPTRWHQRVFVVNHVFIAAKDTGKGAKSVFLFATY